MKPVTLHLQAFGPFAGRETVAFDRLPPGCLFLIAGPTGAGKTSLLDGITYALYGDTSGGERSAREMRSHHADPATLTEVEFEFELGGARYRVRRVPEQERPARRGEGMVKVAAVAELWKWTGAGAPAADNEDAGWQPLAQRSNEVGQRIAELLGFEAEQFRQVVLLPQGQFRKLLAADSKARERILETLFGTALYKRVQDALKEAAAALRREAEALALQRDALLHQAGAESAEALTAHAGQLAGRLAELAAEETRLRLADDAARAAQQQATARAALFAERDAALAAQAALAEREAGIALRRGRLADAQRAAQVVAADEAAQEAVRQQADARSAAARQQQEAEAAADRLAAAARQLAAEQARASEREAAQRELLRLEALGEAAGKLAEAERERLARQRARAEAEAAASGADSALATLEREHAALLARQEALVPQAARVDALVLEQAAAARRAAGLARLSERGEALAAASAAETRARGAEEAARGALESARQALQQLEARWRAGQAARLAAHLHEGDACPVCGSTSHPAPARAEGEQPGEDDLQAAQARVSEGERTLDGRRAAREAAAQARAGVEAEIAVLRQELDLPADAVLAAELQQGAQAAQALAQTLQQARAAATELQRLRDDLAQREARRTAAAEAQSRSRNDFASAQAAAQAADSVVAERRAGLPEALRAPGALDAARREAATRRDALERAWTAAQTAHGEAGNTAAAASARKDAAAQAFAAALQRASAASERYAAAWRAAGFADEATYRGARLPAAEIDALAAGLQRFEQEKAAAAERCLRAGQAVAGLERPDPVVAEAAARAAREAVVATVSRLAQVRGELDTTQRTLQQLAELARRGGDIEARYRDTGELADIADGRNGHNMTFQRYVLAALLDDVLAAASLRLKAMSRGRYLLQRRAEVSDARRAAGLDLDVMDEYTGRARPAGTLSGGEGFMASLALALGLSDVVQAYAGGVQLDTLFIDEGFGSLDPESLDMAMRTLVDLQQRGRLVGVISHVEEMKQQIDVAIEVKPGPRGSSVRIVV